MFFLWTPSTAAMRYGCPGAGNKGTTSTDDKPKNLNLEPIPSAKKPRRILLSRTGEPVKKHTANGPIVSLSFSPLLGCPVAVPSLF